MAGFTASLLLLLAASASTAPSDPAAAPLAVGSQAPAFSTTAHDGTAVQLSKLKGEVVVLYFYPKDDTPGCTKQACDFRDNWRSMQSAGIRVFGVSTQGTASHRAFAEKYKLPFPLLSDERGELAASYRVPVVNGVTRRMTYLIGRSGKVEQVWPQVNPVGHAAEVAAAAAKLR